MISHAEKAVRFMAVEAPSLVETLAMSVTMSMMAMVSITRPEEESSAIGICNADMEASRHPNVTPDSGVISAGEIPPNRGRLISFLARLTSDASVLTSSGCRGGMSRSAPATTCLHEVTNFDRFVWASRRVTRPGPVLREVMTSGILRTPASLSWVRHSSRPALRSV